jgi:hypothetical protein
VLSEYLPQKGRRTGGKLINVPVLPELADEAIAATPLIGSKTFLATSFGKSHASAKALGNKMAGWCELDPMIKTHGLGWKSTIDRRGSHGEVGAGSAQNNRCASKG